ncbi:MAG TPA: GNAT family N-acetyltransferase [Microlunatus sp.]
MTVWIRVSREADHDQLLTIWRAAVESSHSFLTVADIDHYEKVVSRYLPQLRDVRVAVTGDDELVGFIAQDAGEIHMLFVAPSAQGGGVGSALLDDVARGQAVLQLDVNEQNPMARAFYASKGFEQVGRSELDTEGRPFPLLHLRRIRPLR